MVSCYSDLNYSVRRYYIDEFHLRQVALFPTQGRILDIGGKKISKRGRFDIGKYSFQVEYANISLETTPDCLCDVAHLPITDNIYDGAICSEVLEHVSDPRLVAQEAHRVLKPGGILLICVPFLQLIHADPYDYGRYTDYFWRETLIKIGFNQIEIEHQGLFFSVLIEMLKQLTKTMAQEGKPRILLLRKLVQYLVAWGQRKAFELETRPSIQQHDLFRRYSTGFGITCKK